MVLEERVHIAAAPARVWQLVADPERMTAFSPELHHIEWIGEGAVRVGATFRAFNRVGPVRWRTRNVIEVADPGRLFAWRAMDGPGYSFVTRWTYCLLPSVGGCDVVERCETASRLARVITAGLLWGRPRMLRRGMRRTLDGIKVAAEA